MSGLRLALDVLPASDVSDALVGEIVSLLDRAYEKPMLPYLSDLSVHTHSIGRVDGEIVSHAAWVTRFLQAGDGPLMRCAYVELVATDPAHQRRGYAAAVMRRLVLAVADYDIAALCSSEYGREAVCSARVGSLAGAAVHQTRRRAAAYA